jgi:dolichyl-phosphate-mannose-protein mannosyltransferase
MTPYFKIDRHPLPWFSLGMVAVFLVSIALRFWGLDRFNTLVFDEVYYAKFASNHLKGIPIFSGHPPLSTYIIAIGIWIGEHTPIGSSVVKNNLTGLYLAPLSYRWLNALTGSFMPLVVGAIAYQLSYRRSYALIAAVFAAADGLFLVESRYALNNIYLVLFGLLGHWCFLLALNRPRQRSGWLILAGLFLGTAVAVKWNGLGFLAGIYVAWIIAWGLKGAQILRRWVTPILRQTVLSPTPLQSLTQLHPGHFVFFLALIPFAAYRVSWIPFMQLDRSKTFWQWQAEIIDIHHRVGGMSVHQYCSAWYTWPIMWRPVAYFYKTAHADGEPAPIVGPPLPQEAGQVIYDVHAMGNPILWWLASAAVLVLIGLLVERLYLWISARSLRSQQAVSPTLNLPQSTPYSSIALYLVVNWAANWVPWIGVTRCVFIYHYMESLVFSFLAIALLVDRWLQAPQRWHRAASVTAIFLILLGFIFWLPLYLGLPLSPAELMIRRWSPSWI